jgi:tRNA(Arg) A34 adenosine deaminase TadA
MSDYLTFSINKFRQHNLTNNYLIHLFLKRIDNNLVLKNFQGAKLKKFFIIFSIILFLFISIIVLQTQFYHVSSGKKLIDQYKKELNKLGQQSLVSQDVPISAIMIYNYEVLGRGHNTVKRDSDAGGHAVINAISDAIKTVGLAEFQRLSRDSLKIVTTYEPCLMCRGALVEYNIKTVEFLKSKPFKYWLDNELNVLSYELTKKRIGGAELQDSLFNMHTLKSQVFVPDF